MPGYFELSSQGLNAAFRGALVKDNQAALSILLQM
jgi:hypothetical protein